MVVTQTFHYLLKEHPFSFCDTLNQRKVDLKRDNRAIIVDMILTNTVAEDTVSECKEASKMIIKIEAWRMG